MGLETKQVCIPGFYAGCSKRRWDCPSFSKTGWCPTHPKPRSLEFCWAPHCPHMGPGPPHGLPVYSATADCLYITFTGRYFVLVFSRTCESRQIMSQKVTGSHSVFLTISPNPHWLSKKSVHDSPELLGSGSCSCLARPEMKRKKSVPNYVPELAVKF